VCPLWCSTPVTKSTDSVLSEDDGQLLGRALSGDQSAWDALVNRYNNMLWRVARGRGLVPAAAEDAVQTTWVRLLEHADKIRNPQGLGAWLLTTLRREATRSYRLHAVNSPLEPIESADDSVSGPEESLLTRERDAALWSAVEGLHEPCRSLLTMRSADPPASYKQIGSTLGLAVGSIGSTQGRCLDNLRRRLQSMGLNTPVP